MTAVILTIALMLLVAGYISAITVEFGILHSVSRSFYELQKRKKGGWFRAMMFTAGVLIILISAFISNGYSILLYLSGIGAILTGAYAMYYDRVTGIVHYISSATMLVAALTFIGFSFTWVPLILAAIGLVVVYGLHKKGMPHSVFWYELFAFTLTLISLWTYVSFN